MRVFKTKEHTKYVPSFQTPLLHGAILPLRRGRPQKEQARLRVPGAIDVELVRGEPGARVAAQDRFWGSPLSRMGVQGRGGKGHSSRRAGEMESPRSSAQAGLFSGSKGGEEERERWRNSWRFLPAV